MFNSIKRYYTWGMYKQSDLELFVDVGFISQSEYDELIKSDTTAGNTNPAIS